MNNAVFRIIYCNDPYRLVSSSQYSGIIDRLSISLHGLLIDYMIIIRLTVTLLLFPCIVSIELADCKTVVWNGPMGVFEFEKFSKGRRPP